VSSLGRWLSRLYVLSLRFYPPHFRLEFAEEAARVFDLRLKEAAGKGFWILLHFALLEIRDTPITILALHARERKIPAMKRLKPLVYHPRFRIGAVLICLSLVVILPWLYATIALQAARAGGVYASAEDGMRGLIAKSYIQPERSQIIYAGTNSFDGSDPQVWYVIACVWGGRRADGTPVGSEKHAYDQPGVFFLNVKDGWVFVPEGSFPGLLGKVMEVYGMAGPGSSVPSHDWDDAPQGQCTF